jgi:hypothetical protein
MKYIAIIDTDTTYCVITCLTLLTRILHTAWLRASHFLHRCQNLFAAVLPKPCDDTCISVHAGAIMCQQCLLGYHNLTSGTYLAWSFARTLLRAKYIIRGTRLVTIKFQTFYKSRILTCNGQTLCLHRKLTPNNKSSQELLIKPQILSPS